MLTSQNSNVVLEEDTVTDTLIDVTLLDVVILVEVDVLAVPVVEEEVNDNGF